MGEFGNALQREDDMGCWWLLFHVVGQTAEHGVDGTCWKLITIAGAIVMALVTALGIVWSKYTKSMEDRLEAEEKHRDTIKTLYEKLIDRWRSK